MLLESFSRLFPEEVHRIEEAIILSNNYTIVIQIQMTFMLTRIELFSQLNGIINLASLQLH